MNKLMKFGFAVLAVVFSIVSCSETTAQSKEVVQGVQKTAKTTMSIEGMTCAMGCARAIEVELRNIEGVENAIVDFESTTATVAYSSALTSETALIDFVNTYRSGAFKASVVAAKKSCSAEEKAKCDKGSGKSCCASKKGK